MSEQQRLSHLPDLSIGLALDPGAVAVDHVALRSAIAAQTRQVRQHHGWRLQPWRPAADATRTQVRQVAAVRFGIAALLLLAAVVVAAVGAQLISPPVAPLLITVRSGQLQVVPESGGPAIVPPGFAGLWVHDFNVSPDGSRLATIGDTGISPDLAGDLLIWDAAWVLAGRSTQPLAVRPPDGTIWAAFGMDWLADGSGLVKLVSEHGAPRLDVIDGRTGNVRQISPDGVAVVDYRVSMASHRVVINGQLGVEYGVWLLDADAGTAIRLEDPRMVDRVGSGIGSTSLPLTFHSGGVAIAPDDRRVAVLGATGSPEVQALWVLYVDPAAGSPTRVTEYAEKAAGPLWAPTDEWIAYAGQNDAGCPTGLSIVRPDGTDRRRLSDDALPIAWDGDGEGLIVETTRPVPGAPLGGIIDLRLDGSTHLITALEARDAIRDQCHPFTLFTHWYPGHR